MDGDSSSISKEKKTLAYTTTKKNTLAYATDSPRRDGVGIFISYMHNFITNISI